MQPAWHLRPTPTLTALRGICVAEVIAFHAAPGWMPGGWIGVDGFFVLSGFLLTAGLLAERAATGKVNRRRFYARRAARLGPALGLFLLLAPLVGGWAGIAADTIWRGEVAGATFTSDVVAAVVWVPGLGPWIPLWSLAVEEQFYLIWPGLVARWGARLPAVLLVLAGAGVAVRVAGLLSGVAWWTLYHLPLSHSDGLLAGAALAWGLHTGRIRPPTPRQARAVGGGVAAVLGACLLVGDIAAPGWPLGGWTLLAGLWAGAVWAGLGAPGLGRVGPLLGLGTVSYGVYLWHFLLLFGIISPLAILAAGGIALLSYSALERPIQQRVRARLDAPPRTAE